ncbi:TPA: hypothetical protein ACGX4N_003944 [Bacillus cereus]|uniref:hypothetical protein n=1 Tax=Bacillus TaxID=1386 RepID=UPI000BF4AAC1|nr:MULTISPECIES: hypothetical protein [Bacillus]MDA2450899.1 hypothetical protein [Bacillus cereus]MDA2456817.1 hypothetical protein [Bacillus cereus]MDK3014587.1 hypothetical protein [Bacillus sp. RB3]PES00010.1 hypothetical protein CN500_00655 [Bacillus cereus]
MKRKKTLKIEKDIQRYAQSLLLPKKEIHLPVIPILNEGENLPLLYKALNDGLMSRLSRGELILPNFKDCETVAIFTDYGGESKDSKYLTYTITLVDYNRLDVFQDTMKKIREKHQLDKPIKEIAFKDLKYGPINRSLGEYLDNINNLVNGIAFTLVVDKEIHSLADINEKQSKKLIAKILEEKGYGTFKPDVAEKVYRITHLISYLVHLLVPYGKKIFWMSDQDSTIATESKHQNIARLIRNAIYSFNNAKYDTIGYGKPFPKQEDTLFLDLLSISDLKAGAIEHYLTRKKKLSKSDFTISTGADKITQWIANNGIAFKKLSYVIDYNNDKAAYNGGFLEFQLKKNPQNARYIDITL